MSGLWSIRRRNSPFWARNVGRAVFDIASGSSWYYDLASMSTNRAADVGPIPTDGMLLLTVFHACQISSDREQRHPGNEGYGPVCTIVASAGPAHRNR